MPPLLDSIPSRPAAALLMLVAAAFSPLRAAAQETTIDFESLAPGTTVTTQFSSRGVLFSSAFVASDPHAKSGSRVLRAANPSTEFHTEPLVIEFRSGQARVRLFAGTTLSSQPIRGTLRAFNEAGGAVAQDGPKDVAPQLFTTLFEVAASGAVIRRVELQMDSTEFEAIDDLAFTGQAPPALPPESPVVSLQSPRDGAALDANAVVIQGRVTGEGLLSRVTLVVEPGRPPDSTAPPSRFPVPLTGSGPTRSFAFGFGLAPGPIVITAEAENVGGLKGRDTARIVNLPEAIRARHTAVGGEAATGPLRYAARQGGCTMAVYQRTAIARLPPATSVLRGDIFRKWFSLRDQGAPIARTGCPTAEQRVAPGDAVAQHFQEGRIYAGLTTGTHFVPAVFVDAIDKLGGEAATGVPMMDPASSIGAMETWLFQRFVRPDRPQLLPSTLEIRGTPPVLLVERQGGDLAPEQFADLPIGMESPTLWLQFACSELLGPCSVTAPSSPRPLNEVSSFQGFADAGDQFCDGKTWPVVPEWVPVVGHHEQTPILGIVSFFGFADADNPLTHECRMNDITFPSDVNIDVRPLHPFRHLFANNSRAVELEFERCWFQANFAAGMEPFVGDLLFASGRWIMDCGHPSYNSEIHPPSVMASMRTVREDGRPATRADIWVNGIYTGAPVHLDIFPPPRPSPDALLDVTKPVDSEAAVDVALETRFLRSTQVHVRFSATPRHVEVTRDGEMKFQFGRGYRGRWTVAWGE